MCDVLKCAYPEINGCKYKSIAASPSENGWGQLGDKIDNKLLIYQTANKDNEVFIIQTTCECMIKESSNRSR